MIQFFERIKERIDAIKKLSEMKKMLMKKSSPGNFGNLSTESLQEKLTLFIREKKLENTRMALEEQMLSFFGSNKDKSKLFLK